MAHSDYPEDGYTGPSEEDYEFYEKKPRRKPRRYGDWVGAIVIIVIIVILLILINNPGFRDAVKNLISPSVEGYREYPEWADFEVERIITLTRIDTRFPMKYDVEIPTPKDIPNSTDPWLQDVKSVTDSPDPTDYDIKYPDYTWMVWNESGITSTRILRIVYSMHTESAIWNMDPSESGNVDDVPKWIADKYGNKTKEEWVILPAHPQITSLSNQLTTGKITVYDKLKAIFDYMNKNFEYETIRGGEPKICYETLAHGSGDCDDQSVLFISLARAAGIPSWLEFGALYNQRQKSWGGHAWVRAYIPLYSGEGHVYNIDIVNDHFLFRDAYRFSEWQSDGDGDHLYDYYYSNGTNFRYDERYNTLSIQASSNKIRIGEDGRPVEESIPGFEVVLLVPAIIVAALIMRRRKNFS